MLEVEWNENVYLFIFFLIIIHRGHLETKCKTCNTGASSNWFICKWKKNFLGDTCAALFSLCGRKWGAVSASLSLIIVFTLFFHGKNNNSKTNGVIRALVFSVSLLLWLVHQKDLSLLCVLFFLVLFLRIGVSMQISRRFLNTRSAIIKVVSWCTCTGLYNWTVHSFWISGMKLCCLLCKF